MSELDGMFKFKIGDILQPAVLGDYADVVSGYGTSKDTQTGLWEAHISFDQPQVKFIVVERLIQECHGGVQKFYRLRVVGRNGVVEKGLMDLTESELILSAPFKKFRATTKEKLQAFVDGIKE